MHDAEMDDVSTNRVVEYCGIELDDVVAGRCFTRFWVQ
jgi:hypothetical protein